MIRWKAAASAVVLATTLLSGAVQALAYDTYPPTLDCSQYNGPRRANCQNLTDLQQNNPANRRPPANGSPSGAGNTASPSTTPGTSGSGGTGSSRN